MRSESVALECSHPRANIQLPPKSPARLGWQPPAIIPGLPLEAQRVIRENLQAIYDELSRLAAPSVTVPLLDDVIYALPGQTIQGVGNGQQIVLPFPTPGAEPVTVVLDDVISPVTVTSPNGTSTTIGTPGPVDFYPGADDGWVSGSADATLGEVPTDRLVGRDSPGTGPSEYIGVTGGLEFTGTGNVQIADDGVTNAKVAEMPAQSIKVNATNATANPTDLALGALSVLGRRGTLVSSGNIESIDVPDTSQFTGSSVFIRSPSTRTTVSWRPFTLADLPQMADNRFIGNLEGATGFPVYYSIDRLNSPTIIYENTGKTLIRQALVGDVTAPQNSNTTTIANSAVTTVKIADDAVTGDKLRDSTGCSVIGRTPNTSGDPGDIVAAANNRVLVRHADNVSFDLLLSDDIAAGTIQLDRLAGIGPNTVVGNDTGTTLNPTTITVGSNTVLGRQGANIVSAQVATAQVADNAITNPKLADMATPRLKGRTTTGTGDPEDLTLTNSTSVTWNTGTGGALSVERAALTGDVTATANSNATTIANDVVTNAKLANIAAGRVKGLQVDASGPADPVDLTGAEVAELLRLGTVQSEGGALPLAITLNADTTFLSITTAGDGDIRTITGSTLGRVVLVMVFNSGTKTFKHNFSAGTSTALICPGLVDFQAGVRDSFLLIGLGTDGWQVVSAPLGFSRVGTSQLVNDAVTNAKLANMAARTIKGRADGAGTGDPTDLTGLQVGAILRMDNAVGDTTSTGSIASYAVAEGINNVTFNSNTVVIHGIPAPAERGQILWIRHIGAGTCTLVHESSTALASTERLALGDGLASNAAGLVLGAAGGTFNRSVMLMYTGSRWQRMDEAIGHDSVFNVQLANMAAGTIKGRQIDAGTGDPVDLTGSEVGENARFEFVQAVSLAPGTYDNYEVDYRASALVIGPSSAGDVIINGIQLVSAPGVPASNSGGMLRVQKETGTGRVILKHDQATSTAANRIWTPRFVDSVLTYGFDGVLIFHQGSRWRLCHRSAPLTDMDYGDVTVSTGGTVWTIDNDVVTDAKLRNSGACSVIGRSANSSGDPADISAGTNDRVLVRRSNALVFDQVITADIADGVVTVAKLAGIGANTILGNDTAGTLTPNAIAVGTNTVLGRVAGNIVAAQVATGQLADDAVTDAKLRNSGALSVIGRILNSSGDPGDISAVAASGSVLRESGSTLGFGTLATAAYSNNSVTNAKLATMAQSTVKGRSEGAGTGDPTDLTPTQIVAIIDGESPTWTDSHRFDSYIQFQVGTGLPIAGDIRKGSASVLDIRSSNGIQLCGLGAVSIYGSTPSNAGTLLIGDGASGDARLIATAISGASNPELQMTNHVGTEPVNNVCRGVNTTFSSTITAAATAVNLVPAISIPAGSWRVGRTYTATGDVIVSRGATGTACNLRATYGLSGGYTETLDLALPTATVANYTYRLVYTLTCLSVGGSGSFMHSMRIVGGQNNTAAAYLGSVDISPHTVDTTASQTITATVNMMTSVADLSMTRTTGTLVRTF